MNGTVERLLIEMYDCMDEERPMDTRKLKRLLRLDGDCAETLTRATSCYIMSRDLRRKGR